VSIQPITSASSTAPAGASSSTTDTNKTSPVGNGLGQDAFLQLLVTQLEHQDPLQPQDDSQFLAQLAQFSSLEQLTEINASIQQLLKAASSASASKASNNSATSANAVSAADSSANPSGSDQRGTDPNSTTTDGTTSTTGGN
jgi:flagellar basal-body rod modification protein FlgD